MQTADTHYLEAELDALFQTDANMWSFIQQGSLDGVWYWDLENPDVEWMSPEMWVLFGIDPATRKHDPAEWQDLIFQEDLAVALENFEKHCANPDHPYDQIVRYRHADGSTVWVRCRGIAIRDDAGRPIRMLGAHNDLTAVKQAEEATQAALNEAKSISEELRSFAYGISHDLKAPTNTIDMLLSEIAASDQGTLTDEQREMLEMAQQTANQMRVLVDDMLAYTRVIGEAPENTPVPLAETVATVQDLLAALIADSGATITIKGALPILSGHPMQIRTLTQNLIENAIKYRAPDRPPEIKISGCEEAGGSTKGFSITDNGLGIAPEHQDIIFNLFKRLHRKDEVPGAGLGLTLCRRVVANHGGDIALSSTLGRGTTFTITLPEAKA